jgi:hypothetical protein
VQMKILYLLHTCSIIPDSTGSTSATQILGLTKTCFVTLCSIVSTSSNFLSLKVFKSLGTEESHMKPYLVVRKKAVSLV